MCLLNYIAFFQLSQVIGATISEAPIDECLRLQCYDAGCYNELVVGDGPALVTTNKTSLVGVSAQYVASCKCQDYDFDDTIPQCTETSCMNNGTCVQHWSGYTCSCQPGFDGPRCQQTRHSFDGNGWAWFRSLTPCAVGKLSLEFATQQEDGLLMYAGPITDTPGGQ